MQATRRRQVGAPAIVRPRLLDVGASCRHRRDSASSACAARNARGAPGAYGNSTSCTNAIGVVVPSMSRRIARTPRVAEADRHTARAGAAREVRRAEAERLKVPVHAALACSAASSRTCPETGGSRGCGGRRTGRTSDACLAARESDRRPRPRSRRPALRRMNVKQPAAFDDEADFVLVVPVLGVELVEHRVEARRRRRSRR